MKAIGLICLATYLAFCGTLYFAGNGKDFSDPFVQVAGNTTPSQPEPATTAPQESKKTKVAGARRAANPTNSTASQPRTTKPPAK